MSRPEKDLIAASALLTGHLEVDASGEVILVTPTGRHRWVDVGAALLDGRPEINLGRSDGHSVFEPPPTAPELAVLPASAPDLAVLPEPAIDLTMAPRPPLRPPVDDAEADAWAEAVSLLTELLEEREECPAGDLQAACRAVRAAATAGGGPWELVMEAAGWDEEPPVDDIDLWTGGAMALVSVGVDGMDAETARCLDVMELNDWLAATVELVRGGVGTAAGPDELLTLSAQCLDIDSAAVEPEMVPILRTGFAALQPVWVGLGAVDGKGRLTGLGAWGLPVALARAWGGWLD